MDVIYVRHKSCDLLAGSCYVLHIEEQYIVGVPIGRVGATCSQPLFVGTDVQSEDQERSTCVEDLFGTPRSIASKSPTDETAVATTGVDVVTVHTCFESARGSVGVTFKT